MYIYIYIYGVQKEGDHMVDFGVDGKIYRVIQNDCRGIVYSCTDGSRNYQSFLLYDVRCAVVMHFSRN